MSRRVETRTFGDMKVTITQLGAMKSLELLPEITRIIAPGIGGLNQIKGGLSKNEDGSASPGLTLDDVAKLGPAIVAISDALSGKRLARLAPDLLSTAIVIVPVQGTLTKFDLSDPTKIDLAFSDNVSKILPVLRMAIEVTFASFLSEIVQAAGLTQEPQG